MSEQTNGNDLTQPERKAPITVEPRISDGGWTQKQLAGLILILIGVIFLLSNVGLFWWWDWDTSWPVILMGIGLILLVNNRAGKREQTAHNQSTGSDSPTTVSVKPTPSKGRWRPKQVAGLILILVGMLFLLANLGFLWWWNWGTMWPIIVIGIGLFLLAKNARLRGEK